MKKVSAVIIACNESDTIERVLKSVSWCDDIVVVDSGSTDDTVAKAKAFGARVFSCEFDGNGMLKRFAVEQAKHNWVLSVDADEVVSDRLRESILALPEECRMSGYHITRIEQFAGKLLKNSRRCRSTLIRLFDRRHGTFSEKTIHESVELEGRTGRLKGVLVHNRYESISAYFKRFNYDSSRIAQIRFDQGQRTVPFFTMIRFPLVCFDALIIKGAILDGYEGVMMAVFQALYSTVKYAKLQELEFRGDR